MCALVVAHCTDNAAIQAFVEFQVPKVFLFLCSLGDGSFSPSPSTIFFSMSSNENMFDIMHKGKHLFHFSEEIARASTSRTIGDDLVHVVDFTQNLPPKKIWKKVWELNHVFQDVWAIKLPWVEAAIGPDGKMTQVRYIICSQVEKKKKC